MKNIIQSQARIIPSNFINNEKFRKSVLSKCTTGKYCDGFDCIAKNRSRKSNVYFSECGGKIAVQRKDKELIIYNENGETIISMLHPREHAIIQCLAVTENAIYFNYSGTQGPYYDYSDAESTVLRQEKNYVWCWKQGTETIVHGWDRADMHCIHMRYF